MIAFDLRCSQGHEFEGWFENVQTFDEQDAKDMIVCPYCDNADIKKILSPVAVKISSESAEKNFGLMDYKRLAKKIVEHIDNDYEDLGSDFAKEALKMHYDVTDKKNIKGSATKEEEEMLVDEGVQFFKVPAIKSNNKKN